MAGPKAFDPATRRRALRAFMQDRGLKVLPWCSAAGLSEGTLRNFLAGKSDSLSDRSYELLAEAANTPVAVLRGDSPPNRLVRITSRIGAGEQVFPIDGDAVLGAVEAPAGVKASEAFEVDGDSMRPLYGPRDLLFPRQPRPPQELLGRIVAAQIRNGPRVVKQLARGSRKNRWNLVSVNPAHPVLEDCDLETVAAIGAAVYRE